MLGDKAKAMLDVLGISLVSILMIFVVMMILYAVIKLLPIIFREKRNMAEEAPPAQAPAAADSGELLAVITTAVYAYEHEYENKGIPLARDFRR